MPRHGAVQARNGFGVGKDLLRPAEHVDEGEGGVGKEAGEVARVADQVEASLARSNRHEHTLEEFHCRAAACSCTGTGLSNRRYNKAQIAIAVTTPIRKSVSTTTTAV